MSFPKVRKAVIPAAGLGTRNLPATKAIPKEMLTLIDRPLIQWVVDEARAAGIEEFIIVTSKGKEAIAAHFAPHEAMYAVLERRNKVKELAAVKAAEIAAGHAHYTFQDEPLGLGHAVWCAKDLVGDEPFAVLLPDVVLSAEFGLKKCVEVYNQHGGNVITLDEVPRDQTKNYGIASITNDDGSVVEITGVVEKPKPEEAPSNLAITGRYILQPKVFQYLEEKRTGAGGEIQLTDSMLRLIGEQPFHGVRYTGRVHDCGNKLGFVEANIAMGLQDPDIGAAVKAIIQKYNQ